MKTMLFHSDKRMVLDCEVKDYDYRPVKGMGKDRDDLPDTTRLVVLIRQRGICAYCCTPLVITIQGKSFSLYRGVNRRSGQLDHGIPVWQGGRDDVRTMCYLCAYHNGFEFKGGGIELHGAFTAARLGQTTKEDWQAMLRAFIESGLRIYAIPYWWYQPTLPRRLNLPGYDMDTGELDLRSTWQAEKSWYDRKLRDFFEKDGYGKIKKMILPELIKFDEAYSK
jgi:hypothetical protein